MQKWAAIVLCGFVTGVVFYTATGITLALFVPSVLAVLRTAPQYPRLSSAFFLAADVLMGVWVMWLQSVIAGRYGRKAMLVSGLAWWWMKTLQSAHWVGLGFLPLTVVPVSLVTTLVCALVATAAGAFLLDRFSAAAVVPPP